MSMAIRKITASILVFALAACGSPPDDKAAPSGETSTASSDAAAPADAKPTAFAQCAACHSVEPGKNGLGPSLAGVVGRKAGTGAGFAYSDAMKAYGKTWDEASLDTYLAAPMKVVPGTRMTYAGLTDAAQRKELIEYLKTLK